MPLADLRTFLQTLDKYGELKTLRGVDPQNEIGAITEVSIQKDGPALLFEAIPGYAPNNRVVANVCSTPRRGLLAFGMDPDMPEEEATRRYRELTDKYKPVAPKVVESAAFMENVETGDDIDLLQIPVPLWHELDGGPYIGTGVAVIHQDPDTRAVNVGCYRVQLHDRNTTGLFTEPESDGRQIMEKYWAQGKPAPVAISFGPEPLLFLSACSGNGSPKGPYEYEFTGYISGEPVPVMRGPVTGLPISAGSEIVIEGEVPPPDQETRIEGPFGEWTGYYEASQTMEPVVHVKALYYRNDPILFGAPPLQNKRSYSLALNVRSGGMVSRFAQMELPVRRTASIVPLGCTVITVEQQHPDDVKRIMDVLEKGYNPSRLTILVDDDVDPTDPWDVLWAVGTRFDPEDSRMSTVQSRWLLDPLRPMEHRSSRQPQPYKRMIINGCRPFDRIAEFPPVNRFSEDRRQAVWNKWAMADWLTR